MWCVLVAEYCLVRKSTTRKLSVVQSENRPSMHGRVEILARQQIRVAGLVDFSFDLCTSISNGISTFD